MVVLGSGPLSNLTTMARSVPWSRVGTRIQNRRIRQDFSLVRTDSSPILPLSVSRSLRTGFLNSICSHIHFIYYSTIYRRDLSTDLKF